MKAILAYLKQKLRYNATMEFYSFRYIFHRKQKVIPNIASIDDTINKIVNERCSVSRFGDGEIILINGMSIRFQEASTLLSLRLQDILQGDNEGHLVCISDMFSKMNRYNRRATRFWRTHFFLYGYLWDNYLKENKNYYNTFITRPYMDFKSKDQSGKWFQLLKKIWNDRDIVFVEGEKSRLGVGNDLFNNARSIRRILCSATNAFDKYNEILAETMKREKDTLFLIALGPTATVLAYDLFKAGYQAIDAGHVDIEYEWYRMNAKRKVKIPSKYVNEAFDGSNISESVDNDYNKQIICSVK